MPKLGNRLVLTQRRVDALRHPGDHDRKLLVLDDPKGLRGVRGLAVRVYPGGARSYVLRVRIEGRSALLTLGSCDEMTLETARREAAHKLLEARAGRLETIKVPTLSDFVPLFLAKYKTRGKGRVVGDLRGWVRRANRIAECVYEGRTLGARRMDELRSYHLQNVIDAQSPGERRQYLNVARQMWEAARQWREIPSTIPNPADGVRIPKSTRGKGTRKRQLTEDELAQAFRDANRSSSRLLGLYVRLLADTGSRPGELARARWEDVDFDEGVIVLHETKTSETARLVLSESGIRVLQQLAEFTEGVTPWLFPAPQGPASWPYSSIRGAWSDIRTDKTVALKHLRSSAASRAFFDAAIEVAAQKLNHRSPAVTARSYVALSPQQERELRRFGAETPAPES